MSTSLTMIKIQNTVPKPGKIFKIKLAGIQESQLLADLVEDLPCADLKQTIAVSINKTSDEALKFVAAWLCRGPPRAARPGDVVSPSVERFMILWDPMAATSLDFQFKLMFEIINAANYLACESLLHTVCEIIAHNLRRLNVNQMRSVFGVSGDFTRQEDEAIKKELGFVLTRDSTDLALKRGWENE